MSNQLIDKHSKQLIDQYLASPNQSVAIVGPKWLNKSQISNHIAAELLNLDQEKLENYPYIMRIDDVTAKSIGIDEIRQINGFLRLKVPLKTDLNRLVIINRAHLMTVEAQNALLKNLEEPPKGTLFIMTAISRQQLLPTITSRLQLIDIIRPTKQETTAFFKAEGHSSSDIEQAFLISGGLPGLMQTLLADPDHSLNQAVALSRKLLSETTFNRLNSVNQLAKDKDQLKDVLFIIKQMSKSGINSADPASSSRWQRILKACLDSEQKLSANGQTKLVLTNFMLSIA